MRRKSNLLISFFTVVAVLTLCSDHIYAQKKGSDQTTNTGSLNPQTVALMIEDFNYSSGVLTTVSSGSWVNFSGTGNFINVSNGSLTYSGYPSSGVGNKIDIISVGTSAEDVYRQFATQGTGATVYAAFMVNVTNTTGMSANSSTTGDYFAGFLPSTSTTALNARVSVRLGSTATTYQLGLRASSGNAATNFSNTDLNPGTTYLVVLSYQLVAGNSNDPINMWINPAIGGSEPAADLTQITGTTTDNADIARFFIRQGTTTTPNASIDGIRVGNTWASVTTPAIVPAVSLDFNGDGRTDYALTRNSGGVKTWYVLRNGQYVYESPQWGLSTDKETPADYDGDGKTDYAVWREGAQSTFYIIQSATNTIKVDNFGQTGDRPTTVRDYDGDGKADVSVYRPGSQSYFFFRGTLNNPNGNIAYIPWGTTGDVETNGDFDGDGKGDFSVRRNINGTGVFIILRSSDLNVEWIPWGLPTDTIVPGDYDGDGKSDFGVARAAGNNANFYILTRTGGGTGASPIVFGDANNDSLAFGDYDGDGKTDIAVWRATGYFYVRSSASGAVSATSWGTLGDNAVGEWNVTGGN